MADWVMVRGEDPDGSVGSVTSIGPKTQAGGSGAFSDKACFEKRNRRRAPVLSVVDKILRCCDCDCDEDDVENGSWDVVVVCVCCSCCCIGGSLPISPPPPPLLTASSSSLSPDFSEFIISND